jgi:hypothetical protein
LPLALESTGEEDRSVKLSETLNDFLHDLDSAEGWAESDRHDRELAADFEAFYSSLASAHHVNYKEVPQGSFGGFA